MNDVDELLRVVQRKVTVKGSGGVVATVVVTARRGKVWMSIQPPFTWDAIMEPGMVEELIRTLALGSSRGALVGDTGIEPVISSALLTFPWVIFMIVRGVGGRGRLG